MNIKLKPAEEMYYEGRKVLVLVCEESADDKKKRTSKMLTACNHNRKKVISTDRHNKNSIYSSMTEAGKTLNICPSQISKAIKTKHKTKGLTWKKL